MKKIITFIIFAMILCMCTPMSTSVYAQTLNLNITQVEEGDMLQYCETLYDSVNVSKDPLHNGSIHWRITYYPEGTFTDYYADDVTFPFNNTYEKVMVEYWGGDVNDKWFQIYPLSFENVQEPWTEDTRWLNLGETLELEVNYSPTLNYLWPDNSNDWHYTITGPEKSGKVWVRMYNDCGAESDTINVYYNPEPSTVSVDPNTGHIIVTWVVDPTMATYLEYVDIYRDGFSTPIARVPYSAGQYIDEAVDGNVTSRYYAFKGIAYDGSECGWYSDAKPSIHADYTLAVNDDIVILFNNVASKYEDLYIYYIAEWDGYNATHIDSVGIRKDGTLAFNSHKRFTINRDGTIQYRAPSYYFNQDSYLIVDAGFLQGEKRDDNRELRSNKSEGTVSVKASFEVKCSLFPNPATHQFTVMGLETGTLTLYNQLGQVILTQEISGETIIGVNGLPSGVYFAKISTPLGVCTEQVVVE